MKKAATAIESVHLLLQAYQELNIEGVLYYLIDTITWVGTGANEHRFDKASVRELLKDDFLNDPVPYRVDIVETRVIPLTESIYNIFLIAYYSKPSVDDLKIATRSSYMCVSTDEGFKIACWHASVPFGAQADDEYFPIVFANDMIQKATYDSLTGLMNRTSIENVVKQQIEAGKQSFAYILIDLDNFKYVNDHFGHTCGDEVLIFVSQQLQAVFGELNMIGRLGGDEFVVLIPSVEDTDTVVGRVEKFTKGIATPLYFSGQTYNPSASVGIFMSNKESRITYEHCYKAADAAMYRAKNSGKSTWSIENST